MKGVSLCKNWQINMKYLSIHLKGTLSGEVSLSFAYLLPFQRAGPGGTVGREPDSRVRSVVQYPVLLFPLPLFQKVAKVCALPTG